MAKRREDQPAPGAPAWQTTFSDLMNLLLCFFVLLFSMSTVDAEKFELVAASLSSSFSILPAGGSSIGEGTLISSGVSQLNNLSVYVNDMGMSANGSDESDAINEAEKEKLSQSEKMAEQVEEYVEKNNLEQIVEIDFTSQYVLLTLNGALLFDSAQSDIRPDAMDTVSKVGDMLTGYHNNVIEVEGHTDNLPIHNGKYESNNVLSSYRALAVAEYFINDKGIDPAMLKYSGRGEYVPIADNSTAEGRARNRRVEIKIYNELSSN